MRYRKVTVLSEEAASTAGTKTIDIDLQDIITRLNIRFRTVNPASRATIIAHPAALVSKIELVSGSDVLWSLTGYEAQALHVFETGRNADNEISDGQDESVHASFDINFGRFFGDQALAFDPKRFKNPQLKITHNYAAFCASAASGNLLVRADCFDELQPMPVGFLSAKEIETYTATSSAYKYIDIPVDRPYRKLLMRAYLTNSAPTSQIDSFRLSEDNDKRVPIDLDLEQYVREMCQYWPKVVEHFALRAQATVTSVYVIPTYWPQVFGAWSQHQYGWGRITYVEAERQGIYSATAASYPLFGQAEGFLPHHTVEFPFGRQDDIDDWYDVTKLGNLKGRIYSEASATAAVTLFGQQLRRY